MNGVQYHGMDGSQKNKVCVAVRFRPLSDRERERGDHEVWECSGNAVGVKEADVGMHVKFVYDHVYKAIASPIVQSAMDGINGTIFAYGVTSSGKTHTMMGSEEVPGVVPHAIAEARRAAGRAGGLAAARGPAPTRAPSAAAQVFRIVSKTPKKEFLLRLSMMEIYNEAGGKQGWKAGWGGRHEWKAGRSEELPWGVGEEGRGEGQQRARSSRRGGGPAARRSPSHPCTSSHPIGPQVLNDLLDPSRTNLKLREDPRKGIYVEGIKEETLLSAEHALQVIAMGNEHRKTSATAFNEGSSRSHTIIRITLEASDRADDLTDPNARLGRTLSFLNLIDLAGSESAKAEINRSHRLEGSFINKSLLTLGTVIHKLSEGKAAHIPFRDSKLTRLLQGSLTGTGARIAVICTITPASTQAEETHNTLKFASRAKKIEVTAVRNEIMDQSSLIARYQQEIALLKGQLEIVMRERGGLPLHDPLNPEVRTLRERLEEEHMALAAREKEKRRLEDRLSRLTACILHSVSSTTQLERRLRAERLEVAAAHAAGGGRRARGAPPPPPRDAPPAADVATALRGLRSAGALFPGGELAAAAALRDAENAAEVEADLLRKQLAALAEELAEKERLMLTIRSMTGFREAAASAADEVQLQIMQAEREFMQASARAGAARGPGAARAGWVAQLAMADEHSGKLAVALERMRLKLAEAQGVDPESIDLDALVEGVGLEGEGEAAAAALEEAARPLRRGYDHVLAEKVLKIEEKVALALEALRSKEEQILSQREVLATLTGLEDAVQQQVSELGVENTNLRRELERLETQNNNLQARLLRLRFACPGYNLDYMSNEELSELIGGLTQAVERVRVTVQLRRLQKKKSVSGLAFVQGGGTVSGMTREAMRAALHELQQHTARAASAGGAENLEAL
eukprot:scaffold12.g8132.t1